jgi:aspartate kinase
VTDTWHTKARILDVRADRIKGALEEDKIVLVAGFQGVSTGADVTTLGRGGSDTTAIAVAAALGAAECEIYTDVPGVFSADPRIVPNARKLDVISFEEMLEMSASGAGVLQLRSVEYARNHGVRIHCRSSFDERPGTLIMSEGESMEQMGERPLVTGVARSVSDSMVTLLGVEHQPGAAARIFEAMTDANVNVDMITQNVPTSAGGKAEISFTVPHEEIDVATAALEPMVGEQFESMRTQEQMGKVSIVGAGMRSHPGVAAKVFRVLNDEGINIEMISTSPIKISCVITRDGVERAVRALHGAFELSGPDTVVVEESFGASG